MSDSMITIYAIAGEDYGVSFITESTDDAIKTAKLFLADEEGYERDFTEAELMELVGALDDMKIGDIYPGDGFTIRCKQISQKEFLNLLAPEEY
jgi:hypothetical protein